MPSEKNLTAVFTDIANAIREKKGTADQMQPINMADEIANLPSGGGGSLKTLLDATGSASYLFDGYGGNSIEGLISYSDTSNVTSMYYMFNWCAKLATITQLDTSNVTNMAYMFDWCIDLITIPQLNTSKVTSMNNMFYKCSSLRTIPQLDVSKVENMSSMFNGCTSLKSILMTGMKVSFTISASTQFEESDLVTILNNLATVTSTQTLTMGSTNLAKLTDEEKAIATNKGWTLK